MLQLTVSDIDVCRVSKILGEANIQSSITNSTIIINSDDVPKTVVNSILENATVLEFCNYPTEIPSNATEDVSIDDLGPIAFEPESVKESDVDVLDFTFLSRGQVFEWNSIVDSEGNTEVKECVIILQNDYLNSLSDDTIALFCTSSFPDRSSIHFKFKFTKSKMFDYNPKKLEDFKSRNFFIGQIKGINKNQLGSYIGTMDDTFMNSLQPSIDFCLGLNRSQSISLTQLKLLSTVNIKEVLKITNLNISDREKVEEFLKLFGFNLTSNGMEYVIESILIANDLGNYKLEHLAEAIAKRKGEDANEILRLIVARIKENFSFKSSPAISFIKLIQSLLRKG